MAIYNGDDTANIYSGTDGADTINGNGGNDTLNGNGGADTINGGSGDDAIQADHLDTVNGGLDADSLAVSFEGAGAGVTADLRNVGTQTVVVGTLSVQGIEAVTDVDGTAFNDVITVGAGKVGMTQSVRGKAGNDTLVAVNSGVYVYLVGDEGDDFLDFTQSGRMGANATLASAGEGNDTVHGSAGDDIQNGGSNNDRLEGRDGDDKLYGDDGNDTLLSGNGVDQLSGGSGTDTYYFANTFTNADMVNGDVSTTDSLVLQGTQTVTLRGFMAGQGVQGIGTVRLLTAGDTTYGAAIGATAQYNVTLEDEVLIGGALTLDAQALLTGESVVFNGSLESDASLYLYGGAGADVLTGGAAADYLYGGGGADQLHGGGGFDYARYDTSGATGLTVALFAPGLNTGAAAGDTYSNIEGLILTNGNDLGYGSNNADTILGIGGRDSLYGQNGNDTIYGGDDHDLLWGGLGSDFLDGGAGFDYVRYDDATFPGMVVALFAPGLNTGAAAGDTYANIEGLILGYFNDTGYGSNSDDYIYGINGNDALYGQGGNDNVYGGEGNDLLWGGLGADLLDGGDGFDYARYDDASFPSLVASLGTPGMNTGAAAGDTYFGLEGLILGYFDDTGYGSAAAEYLYGINGNDTLYGLGGSDNLYGGAGNDNLYGGVGFDLLSGEGGTDNFYFDTALNASTNVDSIVDFAAGSDKLLLNSQFFAAVGSTVASSEFRSGAGFTTAADADDFIIYNTSTGALYYDADGSGAAAAAVQFATLTNLAALAWTDFVVLV